MVIVEFEKIRQLIQLTYKFSSGLQRVKEFGALNL